jgi:hypothetical protein
MVYAGTIIEINNKKTFVFTMDCGVVTLRTRDEYILGQQITFSKRDKYPELVLSLSKRTMAMAAAFLLLVASTATASAFLHNKDQSGFDTVPTALVSVDINPSIEVSINKDEEIVSAQAKNDDGTKLLESLNLTHKKLTDGVNEIIAAAKDMGYLDESRKVVLVSATLYDSTGAVTSSEYADQLKEILGRLETESNSADLLTVYIDDSAIIKLAKDNDLSIGKELLYEYAQTQDAPLTAEEIRSSSLSALLDKLNALEKNGTLVDTLKDPDPAKTVDKEATTTPTAAEAKEATTAPKPEPVVEPANNEFDPTLKVSTGDTTISFDWAGLPSGKVTYNGKEYYGFNFYKVVASRTNSHPVYPDDGYLVYVSDRSVSKWSVKPAEGNYNCSPELESGETYYVAVTYVFENGKFSSNVKKVTVPVYDQDQCEDQTDEECDSNSISSLDLSVTSRGDTLKFSWTPVCGSSMEYDGDTYKDFNFYKVVASRTNPHPVYPDDGYLTYITDCNASSWSLNPYSDSYNTSPELESGETYYFSITYVFGNGKVSSNTVEYTVP